MTDNVAYCTRDVWPSSNYCIWHAPPELKNIDDIKAWQESEDSLFLYGATLAGLEINDLIQFQNCRLQEADFSRANLYGIDFSGADLRGADFRRSDLRHATLTDADLRGARLWPASFAGSSITEARLDSSARLYTSAKLFSSSLVNVRTRIAFLLTSLLLVLDSGLCSATLLEVISPANFDCFRLFKDEFIGPATELSFSLTAFLLTGLVIVAAIDTTPGAAKSDDDYGEFKIAFKQGVYFAISASGVGVLFSALAPYMSNDSFGIMSTFTLYVVFYLFLFLLIGMILTSKNLVDIIVNLSE